MPAAATSGLDHFWAVIPAGGAGTRLWPLSRSATPKFLLDLTGSGRTLLQQTVDRLEPVAAGRLVVVTGAAHADAVAVQLPGLGSDAVLAEPSPRDSMAAIGLAAAVVERRDPDAVIGSFAADHVIADPDPFHEAVRRAAAAAADGWLVTIGITPDLTLDRLRVRRGGRPARRARRRAPGRWSSWRSRTPSERGRTSTAAATAGTPGCSWRGRACCSTCSPSRTPASPSGCARSPPTPARLAELWPELPRIAIDHAVAEPAAAAGRVAVVPADLGWDDLGDVDALARVLGADGALRVLGDAVARDDGGRHRPRRAGLRPRGRRRRASTTWSSSTPRTSCWSPAGRTPSG